MGLLERRRLLLQNAADSVLDGKYVAFVSVERDTRQGGIFLSSDYGASFEQIYPYYGSSYLPNYSSFGLSLDVQNGQPVLYFISSSGTSCKLFKWNSGVVSEVASLPSSADLYRSPIEYIPEDQIYVSFSNRNFLSQTGSNYRQLGSNLFYGGSPVPPKSRNKGKHFIVGGAYNYMTSYNTIVFAQDFSSSQEVLSNFQERNIYSSASATSSFPRGIYNTGDVDISPNGKICAVVTDIGTFIGTDLGGTGEAYEYAPKTMSFSGSSLWSTKTVSFSQEKLFVGTSMYDGRFGVGRFNTLVHPTSESLEVFSVLPQDVNFHPDCSGSLWSNTAGTKLVTYIKDPNLETSSVFYSRNAGVTWQKSSYPSSSNTIILGVSVYRT